MSELIRNANEYINKAIEFIQTKIDEFAQKMFGKGNVATVVESVKKFPEEILREAGYKRGKEIDDYSAKVKELQKYYDAEELTTIIKSQKDNKKAAKSQNSEAVQTKETVEQSVASLEKRIKNKALLAEELGIGEITLTDILKELEKPARDPRDDMPKPILRSDVLDMKDLKPGMVLKGTVRNVIDFGVFVDIGVHQDGLVHISQITEKFIKHPLEAVSVGDIVDVQVLDCDVQKKRISLTMKIKK